MSLAWIQKTIKIGDLKEDPNNPRKMTKKEFEKLVRSLKEDGYHKRIMVDNYNRIIGGHQRKKALIASGFSRSDKIEVLEPSIHLTEEQINRISIRDNLAYGSFDFDILSSKYDLETLAEFGMDENMIIGFEGIDNVDTTSDKSESKKIECDCSCCKH
jgi:ParB-like chromosome segregation protein Spo0J